jgi:hypothetical protein
MTRKHDTLWSATDVAQLLGVRPEYVRQRCAARAWPHLRLDSGRIRFTSDDVARILDGLTRPAQPAAAADDEQQPARPVSLARRRRYATYTPRPGA